MFGEGTGQASVAMVKRDFFFLKKLLYTFTLFHFVLHICSIERYVIFEAKLDILHFSMIK